MLIYEMTLKKIVDAETASYRSDPEAEEAITRAYRDGVKAMLEIFVQQEHQAYYQSQLNAQAQKVQP